MAKGDRPIVIGTAEEKAEPVVDRVTRNLAEKYPTQSPIEALASLSKEERDAWLGTLTPDQAAILEYDWNFTARPNQRNPRNNKWRILLLLAGRGFGKRLDITTPIPTPNGWTTMGCLKVGDTVFDESGRECSVTATFPVEFADAYKILFSDGSEIVADPEHLWITWDRQARRAYGRNNTNSRLGFPVEWPSWERDGRGPRVRTTGDIKRTLTYSKRADLNHCIPTCGALRLPEIELPIEPYVLGAWLGDGNEADATITCADLNISVVEVISRLGYEITRRNTPDGITPSWGIGPHRDYAAAMGAATAGAVQMISDGYSVNEASRVSGLSYRRVQKSAQENGIDTSVYRSPHSGKSHQEKFDINGYTLNARLRRANLLHNKHVPDVYLRASIEQRTELVRGLMDTDGTAAADGASVEFVSINRKLVDALMELLISLGERPHFGEGRAKLYGRDCGPKYRATWGPSKFNPFHLASKAVRVRLGKPQGLRLHHRMIRSIEKLGSKVAMRCISVDSRHATYLAGNSMIPTHNSRTSSEIVRGWIESGEKKHVALVGANAADLRDIMVEPVFKQGSGIMQICPPWNMPHYSPTKKTIVWSNPNYKSCGAVCSLYSGEEPDSMRGPSHDAAWIDEWAKMKYGDSVMHQLKFTLRRGENPQIIISTTPKPVHFLIDLLKEADESKADGTNDIIIIKGNTFENRSNLSPAFLREMAEQYEGTSLGRQELYADIVLGSEGSLWSMDLIDDNRIRMNRDGTLLLPSFGRTVIGVDPQTGYRIDSDLNIKTTKSTLTGIVPVATGIQVRGQNLHAYVLADDSINGKPEQWGNAVVRSYRRHDAVLVCAERNQGGLMIESVIRSIDPTVKVYLLTAVGKKHERAIPVVTKYEQNRVHHIGVLADLESEMLRYEPGDEDLKRSPNRMDAMVHGVRHLLVDGKRAGAGISITRRI